MINDIENFQVEIDSHAYNRLKQRLDKMAKNHEITNEENDIIRINLNAIMSYELNPKIDFGIFLGKFIPQPNSLSYTITNSHDPGIPFYQIYSEGYNDIIVDSTGDEFWAIIRKNVLKTVMLRKKLQKRSANKERNDDGGLGVNKVIWDVNKFIANEEIEKQKQILKISEKQKQEKPTMNINGVIWVIDNELQCISKKNNSMIFVKFDEILDNLDWNDEIKEEIISHI